MTNIITIKEQVRDVIQYSQGASKVQVDSLLADWFAAKIEFINAWGGEYIYESSTTVCLTLSPDEKQRRFNEFIDAVDMTYHNRELVDFLDWLTIEEVFNNHMSRLYYVDDFVKIPVGTKVSKAFKYFESDEEVLRQVQDQLSTIIQEDKISGKLCLSVHPLDYLSISENSYHWRSCHALDGDYRSGNLQYMVDKSTVVCYLKGAEKAKLPNFPDNVPWNSKKWRMLLFLSDDRNAMFAGRQYPFFSPSGMDAAREAFLKSVNRRVDPWTPWYNEYMKKFSRENAETEDCWLDARYISMGGKVLSMRDIIQEPKRPLFFNDLTDSSYYIPYYCWNRYAEDGYRFHIGAPAPCPCCNGKEKVHYSEMMTCKNCYFESDISTCDLCGNRMARSTGHYIDNEGYLVCEECYHNHVESCSKCGELWLDTHLTYDEEREVWECPYCKSRTKDMITWLPF